MATAVLINMINVLLIISSSVILGSCDNFTKDGSINSVLGDTFIEINFQARHY